MSQKNVYVYVDGFNLYYGCLQGSPHRWLDIHKLAQNIMANTEDAVIKKVHYFTAKVVDYSNDGITTRQGFYLKALETIPQVEIHYGKFKLRKKKVYVKPPLQIQLEHPLTRSIFVASKGVIEGDCYEEKGTDVNLATRLLIDSYNSDMDIALIISNDTDYKSALYHVKKVRGKRVIVVSSKLDQLPDQELRKVSNNSSRKITENLLRASLFPDVVTPSISKPRTW